MAHLNLNLRAFALLSLCLLANQPSRTFLPVVSGNPDRPPGCSFLLGVSRDPDGLCSYACYCPAAGLVPAGVCYKLQPHLSDHLPLSLPVACSHTTLLLYLLPPCALACLPATACLTALRPACLQIYLQPDSTPALYTLCRKWVQNDPELETHKLQPQVRGRARISYRYS